MTTAICKIMLDRAQAQAPSLVGMYPPVAISACLLFAAALEALRHAVFECGPGWQALYIYAYSSNCAVGIPCRNLGMLHVPSMRLLATVLGDQVAPLKRGEIFVYIRRGDFEPLEFEDAAKGDEGDGESGDKRWTAFPQSLSNVRKDACCSCAPVKCVLQTCL